MIPSLPALRAFDQAARLGSFRAAADRLSVSPTAISHHIRSLEDQLGLRLFDRVGRMVILTEDGRTLAQTTSTVFSQLEETVDGLVRSARRNTLRIAAGPIFAARWLMPRLSALWESHPDIDLEVVPTQRALGQEAVNADLIIHWDRLDTAPPEAQRLLELQPIAVASPDFVRRHGSQLDPKDLLGLPLVHQRDLRGWTDWFDAMGVTMDQPLYGPVFEDANVVLRGAIEGQGVVLGWLPLVAQDLRDNRIQRLFEEDIQATHAYFLSFRKGSAQAGKIKTVAEWLLAQSRGTQQNA